MSKRSYSKKWAEFRSRQLQRPLLPGSSNKMLEQKQPSKKGVEQLSSTQHPATRFKRDRLPRSARQFLPEWRATRPLRSVFTAVLAVVSMLLLVGVHVRLTGAARVMLYPVVLVLLARQLRGLEVLVHEASHFNVTRRRQLNDRVANVVAAYPVFQDVARFRESHQAHHELLGHEHDPCRIRFFELGWNELDRSSVRRYAAGMAKMLWAYSASWWRLIGSNLPVLAAGALWHLLIFVLPLAAWAAAGDNGSYGPAEFLLRGVVTWLAYVGVAFMVVLPPMRFIAEAAKHDYENGTTTRTGTVSNIGPIHWLLHPHGDGYHLLHHIDPNIPHHRLREVHEWLMKNDPEYASGRQRHHVLEEASIVEETGGEVGE